jgi:hypothetical protein
LQFSFCNSHFSIPKPFALQFHLAAQVHFQPQLGYHRRLNAAGAMGFWQALTTLRS